MNYHLYLPLLLLAAVGTGCSSENEGPEPISKPTGKVTLQFKVNPGSFSRAGEEENAVQSLYLAFYHSTTDDTGFLSLKKADRINNSDNYQVSLDIIPNKEPDKVVAFANIDDEEILKDALLTNNPSTISSIGEEGNLAMSSPRYFNSDNQDVYYTSFDYSDSDPIVIDLERIAAKVTVSDKTTSSEVEMRNASGETIKLSLTLDGWAVNATDTESYIIRQISDSQNWSDDESSWTGWSDENTLHWAESTNYKHDFTSLPTDLFLVSRENVNNAFENGIYVHETTRKPGGDRLLNSTPTVVLAGTYKIGENTEAKTFYRFRNTVFTEDEAYEYLLKKISSKIKVNDNEFTMESLKSNFELRHAEKFGDKDLPDSYVVLRPHENMEMERMTSGEESLSKENLIPLLDEICVPLEMYKDGQCVFTVPIEHYKKDDEKTFYGVVRNHHYTININSISGIGIGVCDEKAEIKECETFDEGTNQYTISFTLKIRNWQDITQDVTISKK